MAPFTSGALIGISIVVVCLQQGVMAEKRNLSSADPDQTTHEPQIMLFAMMHEPEDDSEQVSTPKSDQQPKKGPSTKFKLIDQGSVSKEQYETITFVLNVILKPIVCLVGTVLNIIGIVVLLQPQLRHGFYIYLLTLSLADTSYLICGLIRSSLQIYRQYDLADALRIEGYTRYMDRFFEIPLCKIGAYTIILFSLDRLLAVILPLKVKDIFLTRYAKFICPALVLFVFGFYLPELADVEIKTMFSPVYNTTVSRLANVAHPNETSLTTFIYAYTLTRNIIFSYLTPVLLCVINFVLVIQVLRARRARKKLACHMSVKAQSKSDTHRLIFTVFIISAFFIVVYTFLIFPKIYKLYNPDFGPGKREHYLAALFPIFTPFAWSVNAAIDFTVYLGTSERFRQTLQGLCCKNSQKAKRVVSWSSVFSRSKSDISKTSMLSLTSGSPESIRSRPSTDDTRSKSQFDSTSESDLSANAPRSNPSLVSSLGSSCEGQHSLYTQKSTLSPNSLQVRSESPINFAGSESPAFSRSDSSPILPRSKTPPLCQCENSPRKVTRSESSPVFPRSQVSPMSSESATPSSRSSLFLKGDHQSYGSTLEGIEVNIDHEDNTDDNVSSINIYLPSESAA